MMTSCSTVLLAMLLALPSAALSRQQEKAQDVAGVWALTVETPQGTGNPTLTLKQDGDELTGTYLSQVFGEREVTGSIKGNAISFSFTVSMEGNTVKVTYSGTVEKDAMKGRVAFGDMGEGTFTAKKK
jgi:hypothetical protein